MQDLEKIFQAADEIQAQKHADALSGKTFLLFFPASSIRTRITFEMAVHYLGGKVILFPSAALDKKEDIADVVGYINNWADFLIVRHKDKNLVSNIANNSKVGVINAMTDANHPCEVLSDLYSLSKIRSNFLSLQYTFVGIKGNIGLAWREASLAFGIKLNQCCPPGYEMEDIVAAHDLKKAVANSDLVITDPMPQSVRESTDCLTYQVTSQIMESANHGALLNPCPPFFREEEVSKEVMDSAYFVGYAFKKSLLSVQAAVILLCSQGK
jgi:ornithine carbamoyltransferase